MVDISTYDFKPSKYNKVKPEEYFINVYIDICLESEGKIISTCRIRRILDAKYKDADLNKVMNEHCQHLSPQRMRKTSTY